MRKIKETKVLQQEVKEFYKTIFSSRDLSKFVLPKDRLPSLKSSNQRFKNTPQQKKVEYIEKIENEYMRILSASRDELNMLISEFENIIPAAQLNPVFSKAVVEKMGYEDMRSVEFPEIFQSLSIKTCIYCLSQLTVVVNKTFHVRKWKNKKPGDVNKRSAKMELDHFYPKSKYPYLSTSFFNLYPVCANCNKAKSDKPCSFELYTSDDALDTFHFTISDDSVIEYWTTNNKEDLEICFHHNGGIDDERRLFDEMFDIMPIYNTQKDIIEELLHKKYAYDKAYQQSLQDSLADLFPDEALIKRLIIGGYDQAGDIHKRPMTKFIQDIAKNIDLI